MSTTVIKSLLHEQINRLQREDDLQDLLLTVSEFINHRASLPAESPELLTQLQNTLSSTTSGHVTAHNEVIKEAKQWITR